MSPDSTTDPGRSVMNTHWASSSGTAALVLQASRLSPVPIRRPADTSAPATVTNRTPYGLCDSRSVRAMRPWARPWPTPGLTNMAVAAPGVTGAAYTNNDLDAATATTLFDIDTALDQVAIQAPANNGTLSPTGKLGIDVGTDAGFDIYSTLRSGRTVAVNGFATLQVDGSYRFYSVNLLSGAVSRLGTFGGAVTDVAIPLNQR